REYLPVMGMSRTHYLAGVWRSVPQRLLFAFGLWFTLGNYAAGTVIWPSTITDPNAMHMRQVLGFIPVMINGWHLYFHLLTGLVCLWLATTRRMTAIVALSVGGIYVLTGSLGLGVEGNIYGVIMADTFGNWVHVAEGAALLAIGAGALSTRQASRRPNSPTAAAI
ncbi:MAG TPA: hypothetical protein VK948_06110, partial [Aeromicrobium sp.]|nr:hypothetical protein [Aeromicrobium sp.]